MLCIVHDANTNRRRCMQFPHAVSIYACHVAISLGPHSYFHQPFADYIFITQDNNTHTIHSNCTATATGPSTTQQYSSIFAPIIKVRSKWNWEIASSRVSASIVNMEIEWKGEPTKNSFDWILSYCGASISPCGRFNFLFNKKCKIILFVPFAGGFTKVGIVPIVDVLRRVGMKVGMK